MLGRRLAGLRGRWVAFGLLWRRSLQVRVATSTLTLSAAVVFVLGMVLQSEITDRLLGAKQDAAVAQTRSSLDLLEPLLIGVSPGSDALRSRLNSALTRLTTSCSDSQQQGASAEAGAFEPVLADGSPAGSADSVAVGPYVDVPGPLRDFVANGQLAHQIHTVIRDGKPTTFLIVGAPVSSAIQPLQLYLLFPLTSEQRTIDVVQSTLLVGGLVVLILLAGITNLVVRQVVRPVRVAAEVAEQLAAGRFSKRMRVVGEDDVARLAESYNAMADSIQLQIRQLQEFGHLQRRFTSDVSHELRTPLTTVRMAADVLHASREQFPAGLSRSTELLVDELDRFEALLTDLLEISRLEAGVEELSVELVDLHSIAAGVIESVRGITGGDTTAIELICRDEATAEVDSRRVERILRNLLANAVDHSDGLPVRLTIGANAKAVAMLVRDFGVGLRPGEADLVFNRFWWADPSRNRRTGGTGLGLAISLEDARLHGGWLEAWGTPGQGASFRLTLPRRPGLTLTGSPLPLTPDDAVASGLSAVRTGIVVPGVPRLGEPELVSLTDGGEFDGGRGGARRSVPAPDRGPTPEDELE
ncbi:MAG: MtrAB system histidine kinase MtrB [Sciscionella sp.]